MKQKLLLAFFLVIFFSCKKDGTPGQQAGNEYYFEATLSDNKEFKAKDTYPASLNSHTDLEAKVDPNITGFASTKDECRLPGDCFVWQFGIAAQKEGTYNQGPFIMTTTEGAGDYVYTANIALPFTPPQGNVVNITISKIERGTPVGILEGSFSGSVLRQDYPFTTEKLLQISGKFRLPLKQ